MTKRRPTSRYVGFGIVAVVLTLGVNTCYGPPNFWRNHKGWKESEVIASLGKPEFDSRVQGDDKPGQPFTMGWYHGIGIQLGLEFDGQGVLVKQWSGVK